MTITISELAAANPAALVEAGERATAAANTAGQQVSTANQMVTTMHSNWQGDAATAATSKAGRYILEHQAFQQKLARTGSLLTAGGNGLTHSRTSILNYVGQLKSQGWQVADDGSVSVKPGSSLEKYATISPTEAVKLKVLATKASTELKTNLAKFSAADQDLADKLKSGDRLTFTDGSGNGIPVDPSDQGGWEQDCDPSDDDKTGWMLHKGLTDEEKAEMERWSQFFPTNSPDEDNGRGDCSRWATASALASQYGTRIGSDGQKEIALPPEVQQNLMNGAPLHFPPTKSEINQIARKQGVPAGGEPNGFPGEPPLLTQQLNDMGLHSTNHSGTNPSALVDELTTDLGQGHQAIVNGAFPGSDGHFISVTGTTTGPNGETLYVVNDSNRDSAGNPNGNTLPSPCTRAQLEKFFQDRKDVGGTPGYSTIEA